MISMYSASWCGDCVRTRAQLDELGLEYEYLDIDAHSEHKARAIDISGRPVQECSGSPLLSCR